MLILTIITDFFNIFETKTHCQRLKEKFVLNKMLIKFGRINIFYLLYLVSKRKFGTNTR